MSQLDYDQVIENYNKAKSFPTTTAEKPKPEGYIFDEDKSVKWNREELERYNENIRAERNRLRAAYYEALQNAELDIIAFLHSEWPVFSESKISKLYQKVFNSVYDRTYQIADVIDECEEYLEIFSASN